MSGKAFVRLGSLKHKSPEGGSWRISKHHLASADFKSETII